MNNINASFWLRCIASSRLPEEFILMLFNEETGYFHQVHGWELNCAVVGAVLAELSLLSRIDTDMESLHLVDPTETGNPTLDPILKAIADEPVRRNAQYWIERLAVQAESIIDSTLDRLVDLEILKHHDGEFWTLAPTTRYSDLYGHLQDDTADQFIKTRISVYIFTDAIPDPRDIIIICLVNTCDVFRFIFELDGDAEERIRFICKMDLIGRSIAAAVEHNIASPLLRRSSLAKQIPTVSLRQFLLNRHMRNGNVPALLANLAKKYLLIHEAQQGCRDATYEPSRFPVAVPYPSPHRATPAYVVVTSSDLDTSRNKASVSGLSWISRKKYGPVFQIRPPFAKPMIFIAGPGANRWVHRHGRMYLRAKDYFADFEKVYGASGVLPSLDGGDHFRLRRAMSPAYSRGRLLGQLDQVYHHARQFMADWKVGDTLPARQMCRRMINAQNSSLALSVNSQDIIDDLIVFKERALTTHIVKALPKFMLNTPKMKHRATAIDTLLERVQSVHTPAQRAGCPRDLADDWLSLIRSWCPTLICASLYRPRWLRACTLATR